VSVPPGGRRELIADVRRRELIADVRRRELIADVRRLRPVVDQELMPTRIHRGGVVAELAVHLLDQPLVLAER
jgi:hypothetical protein